MFDPGTLAVLATFALPPRTPEDVLLNPNIFQDFENGGYFYLDELNEVVTATTTQHIYVIGETGDGFSLAHDYDLGSVLRSDEEINSQLPDSDGLLWFAARRDGVVGTVNLKSGAVHVVRLGSGSVNEITKSLATDASGGVYIPTNRRLTGSLRAGTGRLRSAGRSRIRTLACPNRGNWTPGPGPRRSSTAHTSGSTTTPIRWT